MAEYEDNLARSGGATGTAAAVDEGLRSYMLGVYNYMAMGVALTGVLAYAVSTMAVQDGQLTQLGQLLYTSPLKWVLMFAPLAFVLIISFGINKLSPAATQAVFWAFAAVMGLSISSVFLVFTGASIAQIFFITAAAFAGLSAWGYTTKSDLSGWGSFLIMGVIGLIVASIVNIWMASSALQWAISVITLLVFAGLTAYDNQRLKDEYLIIRNDAAAVAKSSIMGALSLYINFINMFMAALQLFGDRE
ncbi:MAG: Bax inhibitor-1/YccA family protein [Pseudomonadota bacterium]